MEIQNKRILKILELFDTERKVMDSSSIAAMVGVSSRTIRNDIKEANALLKAHGVQILAEPGVGYVFKIHDEASYQAFKDEQSGEGRKDWLKKHIIPSDHNDRISFIIAELLLNALHGKIITEAELADELFISLSTLKKYMKDIKKSLHRFGVEITADRTNGIGIKGDEAQIRYCISEYIFNSNDLVDLASNEFYCELFSLDEIEQVKQIILTVILKYNIHLTDIAFKNLLVHVIITMKRADGKNTTEYSADEMSVLDGSLYFSAAKEIINTILTQLQVDITNEVYYLTQHFVSSKKLMGNDEDAGARREYRELVETILAKIKADIGIDLSGDEELISGLMIHLGAALNRLRFNMNIRNEILAPIKKNYPLAFEMAVIASKVLNNKEKLRTNENEMGFLAIHFGAAMERRKCNEKTAMTAIIACGTGLSTAMFVKSRLQRKFGKQLQILKVSPLYEITQESIKEVDFVFTTVPIHGISSEKIILVEPILTEEDLSKIETILLGDREEIREHFFKKDLFIAGLKASTKTEVLQKMTDLMLKKGYMDLAGKESVFAREQMASTELGGLIAIPHALENHSEEAAIAVAVLEKPIVWDKEKVQVVFLLSIPKEALII